MGVFDKLKTVISSNINDMIAKAENPEKTTLDILREMGVL